MSEKPRTDEMCTKNGFRCSCSEMPIALCITLETELAAALAANQRLEKERDEAQKLVEEYSQDLMTQREVAAELHATISVERDRLMADVMQYRRALECIRSLSNIGPNKTDAVVIEYCDASLAAEHPGAPLVAAVAKACEALIFARDEIGYAGNKCICDALALLEPWAPKVDQSTESA